MITPHADICQHCQGIFEVRCLMCGLKMSDWKKIVGESVINNQLYWRNTWRKLKKFKQESSGELQTDIRCRKMFGPWLRLTMARQILYGILDGYNKGLREIKVGYLTADDLFFIGEVLLTYDLKFVFCENQITFNKGS